MFRKLRLPPDTPALVALMLLSPLEFAPMTKFNELFSLFPMSVILALLDPEFDAMAPCPLDVFGLKSAVCELLIDAPCEVFYTSDWRRVASRECTRWAIFVVNF